MRNRISPLNITFSSSSAIYSLFGLIAALQFFLFMLTAYLIGFSTLPLAGFASLLLGAVLWAFNRFKCRVTALTKAGSLSFRHERWFWDDTPCFNVQLFLRTPYFYVILLDRMPEAQHGSVLSEPYSAVAMPSALLVSPSRCGEHEFRQLSACFSS